MSSNPQRPVRPTTPNQYSPRPRGPGSDALNRAGQPRPSVPSSNLPSPPRWDRGDDRWVAGAKQVLLRCQRDFFNQVGGQRTVDEKKDVEKELRQALLHTRSNTPREQKKEIRRWAMDQHISEVETLVMDPEQRKNILHSHMSALVSVRDDDGGDNMWALHGLQQFSSAIERQDAILANMRGPGSQRQFQLDGSAMGSQEAQATSQAAGSTAQGGPGIGLGMGAGRGSAFPRPGSATSRGGRGGRDGFGGRGSPRGDIR